MGVAAEEERRVLAVIYEMLDAQELGNVGRVLDTLSESREAAHMPTDGVKWETSQEAAQAVTAVPGDLRMVAGDLKSTFRAAWRGRRAWRASAIRAVLSVRSG